MCNTRNNIQQISKTSLNKLYLGMNQQCINCINDCKNECKENCPNEVSGLNIIEINKLIGEQRLNTNKLCEKYNLKMKYMNDMLEGRTMLKYKYRYFLMKEILK